MTSVNNHGAKNSVHAGKGKGKGKGRKSRQPVSGAEKVMEQTITWLLQMPPVERKQMEVAENFVFTLENRAPRLQPAAGDRCTAGETTTITIRLGTVEAAELLANKGYKPVALNFAHGYNCGGGFDHASGSQEEDIFRKTSIFLSLWPHRRVDDGPGVLKRGHWIGSFDEVLPRRAAFYPHAECGGIYSPHVRVVRDLRGGVSSLLPVESHASSPKFAVLTFAAQNVSWDPPFSATLLEQKVRSLLWVAAARGHDSIVLGAFGCGYFGNPSEVVADTFLQLLGPGGEFANVFRLAVFAVVAGNSSAFTKRFKHVQPDSIPKAVGTGVQTSGHAIRHPSASDFTREDDRSIDVDAIEDREGSERVRQCRWSKKVSFQK